MFLKRKPNLAVICLVLRDHFLTCLDPVLNRSFYHPFVFKYFSEETLIRFIFQYVCKGVKILSTLADARTVSELKDPTRVSNW